MKPPSHWFLIGLAALVLWAAPATAQDGDEDGYDMDEIVGKATGFFDLAKQRGGASRTGPPRLFFALFPQVSLSPFIERLPSFLKSCCRLQCCPALMPKRVILEVRFWPV